MKRLSEHAFGLWRTTVEARRRGNPDAGVLNLKRELRAGDERYGAHFAYLGARLKDQPRFTKGLIERYRPAQ